MRQQPQGGGWLEKKERRREKRRSPTATRRFPVTEGQEREGRPRDNNGTNHTLCACGGKSPSVSVPEVLIQNT